MLALIAGTGALPGELVARLPEKPLICALHGSRPDALRPDVTFRLEHLGGFLADLRGRGVTRMCMAGAVRRPSLDPSALDPATRPLVPVIQKALSSGDDGALRAIIGVIEDHGFAVVAAHEIAPDLLPPAGVMTRARPRDIHRADADAAEAVIAEMGASDMGQACIVRQGQIIAREGPEGTAAMLTQFHPDQAQKPTESDPFWALTTFVVDQVTDLLAGSPENAGNTADDGILFKAPKPQQDRRADLPLIGPETAMQAAEAGLAGIVIAAGAVMVLDLPGVVETLDAQKMFLWVRP